MNDGALIGIVSLVAWLILAGSALASYKLSWGKIAQMSLTWLAIFLGVFVVFSLVGAW
ncbi:hypothetical protein ACRAQ6_10540 [Erythrobacter sp. HA6-11]